MELGAEFWALAERFLGFIHRETGLKAIICDSDGVIARANDPTRVGAVHAGAQRILAGRASEAAVTAAEAARDAALKEGYSCPIEVEGRRVGTFGITGPLALTKPLARVAAVVLAGWVRDLALKESFTAAASSVFETVDQLGHRLEADSAASRELFNAIGQASGNASQQVAASGRILGDIGRIAQQSHILSINGAVEAARAGAQGAGFAVVAQAVTNLARDTSRAAQEIEGLLKRVEEAIAQVGQASDQVVEVYTSHLQQMERVGREVGRLRQVLAGLQSSFGK